MQMSEVLRRRRTELGMSQAELATAAGIDARQIRRYEAGEQQPALPVAVAIADALKISVGELAGLPSHAVNLTGDWYAAWQSTKDGADLVAVQPIRMRQQGELVQIEALERGRDVEAGGYLWRGELRLWDNEILMGWYASIEPTVRSKGTLYLNVHTQGLAITGRWVGLSYDGQEITGLAGLAHDETAARGLVRNRIDGAS
jgi:transcriptional regulator with XRE-family HTH domain